MKSDKKYKGSCQKNLKSENNTCETEKHLYNTFLQRRRGEGNGLGGGGRGKREEKEKE